jgi:hypothetical protein
MERRIIIVPQQRIAQCKNLIKMIAGGYGTKVIHGYGDTASGKNAKIDSKIVNWMALWMNRVQKRRAFLG